MRKLTLLTTFTLLLGLTTLYGQDTIPSCVWGRNANGWVGLWEYLDGDSSFATGWDHTGSIWSPRHYAGQYYVSHDTVTMFGDANHFCGTDTGIYIFTLDTTHWRDTLIVTLVSDPCTQRTNIIASYSYLPCWSSPIAGIEENTSLNPPFKIYPNPASNTITIENLRKEFDQDTKIILYDLLGNKLLEETTGRVGNTQTLNIGHLSSGVYILQVVKDHAVQVTERIVIDH